MKKILISLSMASFLSACNEPTETYRSMTVELTKNEVYVYDTKNSGDEEGGAIVSQAQHFAVSDLSRDPSFALVYTYQPAQDYTGSDEVQIRLDSGSDGAGRSTHHEFVTISFEISE